MKRHAIIALVFLTALACSRIYTPAPTPFIPTSTPETLPSPFIAPTKLPPQVKKTRIPATDTPPVPTASLPAPTETAIEVSGRAAQTLYDVTYCTMGGVALKMDVYMPESVSNAPAVILIHGGAWSWDSKNASVLADAALSLVEAGMVAVAVDYRLAPAYQFPAMIEDVKCAVRSIRAHAQKYGVDPNQVAAYGGSAGGHLAALLGVTDGSEGFDVGEYLDQSSRVQAVVDLFGPTNIAVQYELHTVPEMVNVFLPKDFERASPIYYVTPDDPPFLILHGAFDAIVPLEQSQILHDLLTAQGVPSQLIVVENGGHGFGSSRKLKPNLSQMSGIISNFLIEMLK